MCFACGHVNCLVDREPGVVSSTGLDTAAGFAAIWERTLNSPVRDDSAAVTTFADGISVDSGPLEQGVGGIPANSSTTARVNLNETFFSRLDTATDSDWIQVDLVAGQTYEFRLFGYGNDTVGDTFLALKNAQGQTLASNDDAFGAVGYNSIIDSYTATQSGTFYLDVSSRNGQLSDANRVGDYMLTAVVDNVAGPVLTADEIAFQLTTNFLRSGLALNDGSALQQNIDPPVYNVGNARQISFDDGALTAQGRFLAANAMEQWSDLTGINFVRNNSNGQIVFEDTDPNGSGTTAYVGNNYSGLGTDNPFITSSLHVITTGWENTFGTGLNSYTFETYIHEMGHALGLGHGGNYNGNATFGVDNWYLNDSLHESVMSYMQANNDEFSGPNTFVNASFRHVLTPMVADILAIEQLYGDRKSVV